LEEEGDEVEAPVNRQSIDGLNRQRSRLSLDPDARIRTQYADAQVQTESLVCKILFTCFHFYGCYLITGKDINLI